MDISLIKSGAAPSGPIAVSRPTIQPQSANEVPKTEVQQQVTVDAAQTEEKRLQNVEKAARILQDTFVVSDVRFTIFKDLSGQYITRFTSLRDGKITYIPEPELLSHLHDNEPLLDINV